MLISNYITPVMFTDSTGYWFGFDDVITGPVDEIIVLGLLGIAALLGVSGASDALDDLGSALNNTFNNLKEDIKRAINSTVVKVTIIASIIERSNNGTYAIQFSDGNYYIGKGSPIRMYTSALIRGLSNGSVPVSFRFEWAKSDKDAFKKEYIWMVEYGYYKGNTNFYNRIWSPGRLYYWFDNNFNLYPGDYWGR